MLAKDKILRGRYRVIRQLGQGETGAVYEAYDSNRETNVALKEILIDLNKVPSVTEREVLKRAFADQAKILAKLKHESLPQLLGYFAEIDRHYLVMELVDGEDASELLAKSHCAVKFSEAANWADQLLDALDYLHTFTPPVIHRGIKPQNIKLTSRGKIKLLGFDIVKDTDATVNAAAANQAATAKLNYLPLEQILRATDLTSQEFLAKNYKEKVERILKQPVDSRSDIYALGATLYHLVTARLPINALERTLSVWAEKADPLPTPHQVNADVPPEISDVLMKALEIEREARFESAMDVREALQKAVGQAKERELSEAKQIEETAAREMHEQERLQIEEQKQQTELIKRQLEEAEAQRIKAEQRAAEAEKQLSAKKTGNSGRKDFAAADKKPLRTSTPAAYAAETKSNKQKPATDDFKTMLGEPEAGGRPSWLIPGAAVMLLAVCGVILGIWFMQKSDAANSAGKTSNQPAVAADKPAAQPATETKTEPVVETKTETAEVPKTSLPSSFTETPANQPTVKIKPAAAVTAPRVEKPAIAAKTQPKPKKTVTVDDLIGGN